MGNYLAGNYGAQLLALHGADVVKVEPTSGEASRSSRPYVLADDGGSETWSHFELRMMRGVSSVVLDLDMADDRRVFDELVSATDIFWTNLRAESARRRDVDWEHLQRLNRQLVYVSLTGFGLVENGEGEFSGQPAFDILVQGLAGLLSRNADQEGTPHYNGLPLADQVTSTFATLGALLGLRQRDRTGEGCCVDVPMFDTMLAINEKAISMYGVDAAVPPARASATTAPFGLFHASDGYVCVAVGSDSMWRRFAAALGPLIGRDSLAEEERYRSGTSRVKWTDEITALVEMFTSTRTKREVVDFLLAHDVPAGLALEVDDLNTSAHVKARGIVREITLPGGTFPAVMSPITLSGTSQSVELPHRLGEDRARVIDEWLGRTTPLDGHPEPGVDPAI